MSALTSLTGRRFGRLVVVARAGSSAKGQATWRCRCDCGTVDRVVRGDNLLAGRSASCGCLKAQTAAAGGDRWL